MFSSVPNHALARIFAQDTPRRVPVGAGFLVSPRYLLTCAHVVESALGLRERAAEAPTQFVEFDFPLLSKHAPLRARVARWHPVCEFPAPGEPEDIALLEILAETPLPPDARPIALLTLPDGQYAGRSFRAYGLPSRTEKDGDWTQGQLQGRVASGRVQLGHTPGFREIEKGFSGAAVWQPQEEAALGMVVGIRSRHSIPSAYMIPAALLLDACPELESAGCAGESKRRRPHVIAPDLLRFHEQALNLKQECAAFSRIVTGEDAATRLLLIHGKSGMSKTHLLGLYEQTARAYGLNVLRVDYRVSPETTYRVQSEAERLLYQLICHCGGSRQFPNYAAMKANVGGLASEAKWEALTDQFFIDLGDNPKIPPLILLIDTFERAERAFKTWLTQIFLPQLAHQQTIIAVVAGQDETPPPATLNGSVHCFHLCGVPLPECERYARERGRHVEPGFLARVHHALQGQPMAIVNIVQSSPLLQEARHAG